ncbi:MAG: MBL fold metallo-hydrolase [Bdellovibrio sp.]
MAESALKISRILHAGYVFEHEGVQVAFDTIFENPFSRNCYAFPSVQFDREAIRNLNFSAVFISHFHDDHFSLESLDLLNRQTPIYMFCVYEELVDFIRKMGFVHVRTLKLNEPITIGSIEVIPRRALDEDVDCLFQVKAAGLNILNVVDSWVDYDTLDLLVHQKPWDMVLWPFQTMRELEVIAPDRAEKAPTHLPPEWIEQLQHLKPKVIVPSSCQFSMESWSWYNYAFFPVTYRQFTEEVSRALPQAQILRLNPGCSVQLVEGVVKNTVPLSWVIPVGDQNVDYEYLPEQMPPTTAEIAKKFPKLTTEQRQRTVRFCQHEIIERFKELEASPDIYFEKVRLWHLKTYDDAGMEATYGYLVEQNHLISTDPSKEQADWTTEVPLAKLYAALELGESLTSMYVRINGSQFEEIVDDPLIRCLFNGSIGSYQKAQLLELRFPGRMGISV